MREVAYAASVNELLGWDQETGMPERGLELRAGQLQWLSGVRHRLSTAPEVGDWIKACEDAGYAADSAEGVNVREWRRDYDRVVKLPDRLVEDIAGASSRALHEWSQARAASDFSLFLPHLEKLVALAREKAECLGYARDRYDALLDEHEPGSTTQALQTLFDSFQPGLSVIALEAAERSAARPGSLPAGEYPVAAQVAFNAAVSEAFGFDFTGGRVDATTHPFCSGFGPGDVRLTTRYDIADFSDSLYSVLHECGHGLYEQGLLENAWGSPCGQAASLGIHESQSRLWENHVGRTVEFWQRWLPVAAQHFPQLAKTTPEQLSLAVSRVQPSFIRVEADEVTYDLHVILRFRIEAALFDGSLRPADVPAAWNEQMKLLLDLDVPDDRRGCLQDIHWSMGGFGYFPTYTLGNINAAQLMNAAHDQQPGLPSSLAAGEYSPLLTWLRTNIHHQGRRYQPADLIQRATGAAPDPRHRLAYLRAKYL